MPPSAKAPPPAASVEDCDSDNDEPIVGSKKIANTAAKRSAPPGLDLSPKISPDAAASDSGYSSRTGATLESSGNSPVVSKSTTSQSEQPTIPPIPPLQRVDSKRASRNDTALKQDTSRPASKSRPKKLPSDPPRETPQREQCAMAYHMPPSPLEQQWNINYPPFAPSPQQSAPYPQAAPQPPYPQHSYGQQVPALNAPQQRRRSTKPRPSSYHPGVVPPEEYFAQYPPDASFFNGPGGPSPVSPTYPQLPAPPATYPEQSFATAPPQQAPAPPPNGVMAHAPMVSAPPAGPQFLPPWQHGPQQPPQPSPTSQYYPRPGITHRASDATSRGRPMSQYGPAMVYYDMPRYESAPVTRASSARRMPVSQQYIEYDNPDRRAMPPPPRRPSKDLVPYQSSSNRRKPMAVDSMAVEGSCDCSDCASGSDRSPKSRDRKSRSSRTKDRGEGAALIKTQSRSSQRPSTEKRRPSYSKTEARTEARTEHRRQSAEEYQKEAKRSSKARPSSTSPTKEDPLDPGRHLAQLTKSRTRNSSSQEGSQTSKSSEPFTIRLDVREGFNMRFGGDMDGRMLSVVPTEDGMAELTIGGSRRDVKNQRPGGTKTVAPKPERYSTEKEAESGPSGSGSEP